MTADKRPQCAKHGGPAYFTCPRCGAFMCLKCLKSDSADPLDHLLREMRTIGSGAEADRRLCTECFDKPQVLPGHPWVSIGFAAGCFALAAVLMVFFLRRM